MHFSLKCETTIIELLMTMIEESVFGLISDGFDAGRTAVSDLHPGTDALKAVCFRAAGECLRVFSLRETDDAVHQ